MDLNNNTDIIPSDAPPVITPELVLLVPNISIPGVSGFKFSITEEERFEATAEITENWVETNNTVTDHIALKPERFTLKGRQAELVRTAPVSVKTSTPTPTLGINSVLSPSQDIASVLAMALNLVSQVTQSNQAAISGSGGLFSKWAQLSPGWSSSQSMAFNYIYALWTGRILMTVQTPWGVIASMAVEKLVAVQPTETNGWTEFEVTFKKIRLAQAIVTKPVAQNRGASTQAAPTQSGVLGQSAPSGIVAAYVSGNVLSI